MNGRFTGWLAAVALALTLGGALCTSAQTVLPGAGEHNLLAIASPAPMAARGPDAPAPADKDSSSFNWTGFYVGAHIGHGNGNGNMVVDPLPSAATFVNLGPTQLHTEPVGVVGGVQGGYNRQKGQIVFGVEGDYSNSGMTGTKFITPIIQNNGTPFPGPAPGNTITSHQDTDWTGTVRARLGLAVIPKLLLYSTGGLALGHVVYFGNTNFTPVGTENYPAFIEKTRTGWTVGGGMEVGLASHFTTRFEYIYYDLGKQVLTASPVPALPPFGIRYTWATSAQIVRGGINFKF